MGAFQLQKNGKEMVQHLYSSYDSYIGKGLMSYQPDYQYPCHWHDEIELSAIIRGEMKYNVNGEIITVREGEAFFINSRRLHFNFSPDKNDCEYICILLHPMLLRLNSTFEQEFVIPLINNQNLNYLKLSKQIPWQEEIRSEILQMYRERKETAAPLLVQSHFYKIWATLFTCVERIPPQKDDSKNLETVKAMINYIQENYEKKLTLPEIAAAGFIGQSKCCALFKEYIHSTPVLYLNQFRLRKSRELLRNPELSISEIAGMTGFSGSSYYTESYHKYYGETPSEYRKTLNIL